MILNMSTFATWVINSYFIYFVSTHLCPQTSTLGSSRSDNLWHYFLSCLVLPSLCISQLLTPSPTRRLEKENLLDSNSETLSVSWMKVLWENIGWNKEFGWFNYLLVLIIIILYIRISLSHLLFYLIFTANL